MIRFDHIAIGCATLEQGAAYVADQTGLSIPMGGEHPLMGTHNLLMSLSADTFFEVISINPTAPNPSQNRWFGLDDPAVQKSFSNRAKTHSWVLNSDDLDKDLAIAKSLGIDLGTPRTQTRGDLTWRFAVREDGAIPLDGAAPMIMEWPTDMQAHPASGMTDLRARLKSIVLNTRYAKEVNKLLNTLGDGNMPIEIHDSPETKLTVTLTLQNGREAVLD
ncbi:MAG: VOC family protein [Rhodobacteraceae bacterium]|nr:VOC family protein [Paracoccaceae bacterium]